MTGFAYDAERLSHWGSLSHHPRTHLCRSSVSSSLATLGFSSDGELCTKAKPRELDPFVPLLARTPFSSSHGPGFVLWSLDHRLLGHSPVLLWAVSPVTHRWLYRSVAC
jgi:hypothetical protein